MQSNAAASTKLEEILREEKEQAATDRQNLLSQISNLIVAQGDIQDKRLGVKVAEVQQSVLSSKEIFEASRAHYSQGMDAWSEKEDKLAEEVLRSRETLKIKLKEDWVVSNYLEWDKTVLIKLSRLRTNTIRVLKSQHDLFMTRPFGLWTSR
jgi:kinesin family protein 11